MTHRRRSFDHHPARSGARRAALHRMVSVGAFSVAALLVLGACEQPVSAPTAADQQDAAASLNRVQEGTSMRGDLGGDGNRGEAGGGRLRNSLKVELELAALRRVTAPFHDIANAEAAGWNVQLTGCMENPPAGGMGYHYANTPYIDGTVQVRKPQLLLYEPQKDGRMRLVAVEYIIPYSFIPETAPAPVLFGQKFHQNAAFQLWGLHAWVWEHNPSGMFADWNPRVSCQYAK
ncbi:MAG: hypothetical protein ACRENQ_09845 [Gemmatimonadaceae bacterium]